MTTLKIGDLVSCKIKSNSITDPTDPIFDQIKTFEIIARDDSSYFIYIPHFLYIKESVKADSYMSKLLGIDLKFHNEQIVCIQDGLIFKIHTILDGSFCTICKEFYSMAEPNQRNNTFICYMCQNNPY